ncbi:Response regulator receiver domain-containing protein [Nitrosospira multiformis]|uniref:Response regulator receiver domain-containing protein n=1 Tax=Nitrosospira multiformis TaxID=1231 RepID=A0A1H8MQ67_9PROT|nr:response regulator [Nitrosospira multiformis]SEO19535.1 Response regulator receiver domain-containing protein [Nitrosospira multiformis]
MDNKNPALSGIKVLVVDDNEDTLALTTLMLSLCGAQVIASPTAAQGLEQVQMQRLDIIISDISMPRMDGYQFIRAVRDLPIDKGKQTPALALTAFNSPEYRSKAFDAGFQAHLSKPASLEVLVETIAGMISLPDDLPN